MDDASSICGTEVPSDYVDLEPAFPTCIVGAHLEPYPSLCLDGEIRYLPLRSVSDLARFNWAAGMYFTAEHQRLIPGTTRVYRWGDTDPDYVLFLDVIHPPLSSGYFIYRRGQQFYLGKQVSGSSTIDLRLPSP
jgi:hypothetical protein